MMACKKICKSLCLMQLFLSPLFSLAQFAPPAGQDGSTAIHCDSTVFVAWASSCTVNRGPQQINDLSFGYASYGVDGVGVGKADNDVVSLGDGGDAVLTFETPIYNGPGYDFAVFENALNDTFLELGFVEVSSDGENYFRFPSVSLTSETEQVDSFGSLQPTSVHNLAGKYRAYYGTPFDLDDVEDSPLLDKFSVTYVRVVDAIGTIDTMYCSYDSQGHIVNDPWPTPFYSSGFDLDAVGVIHNQNHIGFNDFAAIDVAIYPNPASHFLRIESECFSEYIVFNTLGQVMMASQVKSCSHFVDLDCLQKGVYYVKVNTEDGCITQVIIHE